MNHKQLIYPYKHLIFLSCIVISLAIYWQLGTRKFVVSKPSTPSVETKKLAHLMEDPKELIEKIKLHIKNDKNNHTGWYVLAKLYVSQGDIEDATYAINQAIKIKKHAMYERLKTAILQRSLPTKASD